MHGLLCMLECAGGCVSEVELAPVRALRGRLLVATLPWYALDINSINMDAFLQSRISNVHG